VSARISPDGTRVALDVRDQQSDVWIWDFARETMTRLTMDLAIDSSPIWTRDGGRIVFSSNRLGPSNLFAQSADGTGAPERLTEALSAQAASSISPDGRQLIFREQTSESGQDLRMLALDKERRTLPLVQARFNERNGEIAPDGTLIAYESNESGRFEVYVTPFPKTESGRSQISTAGGFFPAWAPNGRELFYVADDGRLMAVDIRVEPAFMAGTPRVVVDRGFFVGAQFIRTYDVSPDGTRFLLIDVPDAGSQADTPGLTVVLNWSEELKRLAPRAP
jgi:serine/threonine-protein kinase